ncbi:MAG: TspO/MBR family protein [Chloroflexaceae bacterium]|nr:TspO/MBR family protein [Chloroflexaceae bacterium]
MIPSWLVIGIVEIAIAVGFNAFLSAEDRRWFFRLRRPSWLTFERLIPVIWLFIFVCGGWSAYITWESRGEEFTAGLLMFLYVAVEVAIVSYTPVMLKFRSLLAGTLVGGTGFVLGCILAVLVAPLSGWAVVLLLPYLLWSPIGTYVTWKMIPLNPGAV